MTKKQSKEFTELQAKYIAGVERMKQAEVERFLSLLHADADTPFREVRIPVLERRLADYARQTSAEQAEARQQAYYVECGRKFLAITDRWVEKGVVRRPIHDGYVDAWFYEGNEIFRQYGAFSKSAKRIDELLEDAERVDAEIFGEGAIE